MTSFFNSVLTGSSTELSVTGALVTLLTALIMGGVIAFTYFKTQEPECYQRSLAVTLCMLPAVLSVIILFVGSNIARAFSMAGTLSIIRFRSAPGDPKEIGYVFFSVAAGLACGVGLYGYGALFVLILCLALILLERAGCFTPSQAQKVLKITVPEDLNRPAAFEEILEKYTGKYTLATVKTTDLGSLFELVYRVSLRPGVAPEELINDLRTRNGNLTIILSEAPKLVK